jgi:hypothetical protein
MAIDYLAMDSPRCLYQWIQDFGVDCGARVSVACPIDVNTFAVVRQEGNSSISLIIASSFRSSTNQIWESRLFPADVPRGSPVISLNIDSCHRHAMSSALHRGIYQLAVGSDTEDENLGAERCSSHASTNSVPAYEMDS